MDEIREEKSKSSTEYTEFAEKSLECASANVKVTSVKEAISIIKSFYKEELIISS